MITRVNQKAVGNALAELRLSGRLAMTAGLLLASYALVSPMAWLMSGGPGLVAAASAAGIVLLAGALALVAFGLFKGPMAAMGGALAGMQVRMVVPLVLGVTLHLLVPSLAAAGFIYYLLTFYMVGLIIETALVVAAISPAAPARRAV